MPKKKTKKKEYDISDAALSKKNDPKEYERAVRQLKSTVDQLEVDVKILKSRMGL